MPSDIYCGRKHGYTRTGDDGNVVIAFDCDVYPAAVIEVTVTPREFDLLYARSEGKRDKLMQEIVPHVDKALREIFISGYTPAEFDKAMTGKVKPMNQYPGYRKLDQ